MIPSIWKQYYGGRWRFGDYTPVLIDLHPMQHDRRTDFLPILATKLT